MEEVSQKAQNLLNFCTVCSVPIANVHQCFMMLAYVCLYFITKLDLTSCQFKDHIDLQKIAEIMFQNEKYNVLKPTVHIIEDHFVEFIQKRHNTDASERMFLDGNGFRHIWKGLEIPQPKSLRKTNILQKAFDKRNNNDITKVNTSTTIKKHKPRRSTKTTKKTPESVRPVLREGETIVKTTFFCPFFGVVRMTTHFDKDEIGNNTMR